MAYVDIGGGPGGGGAGGGGLIPFAPSLLVAVTNVVPSGARSIDGHTTAALERVLLTAQTDPIQNGIWLTDGVGVWQRPADLPVGANSAFAFTFIQEGDVYANTGWANGSVPSSIVGVDPQAWVQVIAPGQLIANNGLTLTGSTLDVTPDADGSLVATPHNLKVGVISDAQHGNRGGGLLHAAATNVVAGFMSAADKAKLDTLPTTGSVPPTRLVATGVGLAGGGDLSMDRTLSAVAGPDGSIVVSGAGIGVGVLATDAQHGIRGGGTLHAAATAADNGFMTSADFTKLAGVAPGATATPLTLTMPLANQPSWVGTIGGSTEAARADHRHPAMAAPPVTVTKSPNDEGSSANFARADHKHDVETANVLAVGIANTEGTGTALARADHVHAHGAQTDPTLHALVTPAAHGFMSSTDKTKLDGLGPSAGSALVFWGSGAISGTNTTRYLHPFYSTQLAPTAPISYRVPRDGTFKNMRVRHNTPAGNGGMVNYRLRVNGVGMALFADLSSTGSDSTGLAVAVPVVAGDLVDIEVTKGASIATSPTDCLLVMEFTS